MELAQTLLCTDLYSDLYLIYLILLVPPHAREQEFGQNSIFRVFIVGHSTSLAFCNDRRSHETKIHL